MTVEDRAQLVRFEGFHEIIELDELDLENTMVGNTVATGPERVRSGVRYNFGGSVAGFLQIFRDEFNLDSRPIDFDLFGLGVGVNAAPVLGDLGSSVPVSIPLKAGMNIALGEDDGLHGDEQLLYADLEVEIGLSFRVHGLQPTMGL